MSEHASLFAEEVIDLDDSSPQLTEQNNTLKVLSNLLAALKADKEELEAKLKAKNADVDKVTADLIKHMRAINLTGFKTPRGTFSMSTRMFPSIVDQEKAYAWLREHNLGSIIKETVHSGTLGTTVKELLEGGILNLAQLEEVGLSSYNKETISLRKK